MRPSSLALFTFISRPVNKRSSASGNKRLAKSLCVPPAPGNNPNLTSGRPNPVRLSLIAIR